MSDSLIKLEREYQNELIDLFTKELGYEYFGSLQYPQDKDVHKIGGRNSPVMEDELRRFLVGGGINTLIIR